MTNTRKTIRYSLLIALMFVGASLSYGSEVTGTLSGGGNASEVGGPLGSTVGGGGVLAGTVTGGNGGGGSSGGGSSGGGRNNAGSSSGGSSNQSDGQVLGASTASGVTSPSFPNAGIFSEDSDEETNSFAGVITTASILLGLIILGSVFLKRRTNE